MSAFKYYMMQITSPVLTVQFSKVHRPSAMPIMLEQLVYTGPANQVYHSSIKTPFIVEPGARVHSIQTLRGPATTLPILKFLSTGKEFQSRYQDYDATSHWARSALSFDKNQMTQLNQGTPLTDVLYKTDDQLSNAELKAAYRSAEYYELSGWSRVAYDLKQRVPFLFSKSSSLRDESQAKRKTIPAHIVQLYA